MKMTRYSPCGYGAMGADEEGKYVRIEEAQVAVGEYVMELKQLKDLLRWRKVGEETAPVSTLLILWHPNNGIRLSNWNRTIPADIIEKSLRKEGVTHWRPIGPLPEGGK